MSSKESDKPAAERPLYSDEGQFDRELGSREDPWREDNGLIREVSPEAAAHDNARHRAEADRAPRTPPAPGRPQRSSTEARRASDGDRYWEFGITRAHARTASPSVPRRRGPKGWKRPDASIHDDLCSRLYRRPDIDSRDVAVAVNEGLVILEGTVPDRHTKYRIEDMAEVCPGVREVDNRIGVRRRDAMPR